MTFDQTRSHIKFYAVLLLFYPVKCPEYVALLDKSSTVEIIYLLFISPNSSVFESCSGSFRMQ
jgi:hypothetical protein